MGFLALKKFPGVLCKKPEYCTLVASTSCPENTRVFWICSSVLYSAFSPMSCTVHYHPCPVQCIKSIRVSEQITVVHTWGQQWQPVHHFEPVCFCLGLSAAPMVLPFAGLSFMICSHSLYGTHLTPIHDFTCFDVKPWATAISACFECGLVLIHHLKTVSGSEIQMPCAASVSTIIV